MNNSRKQLLNTIKQLKANNRRKKRSNGANTRNRRTNIPAGFANTVTSTPSQMRFRGSERFLEVSPANGQFKCDSTLINATTFPWLNKIALMYDKYRFLTLKFRYVNFCNTQTSGEVNLSFDFDPKDANPASMNQASNNAKSVSTSAYKNATLVVPVNSKGNNQFRFTSDSSNDGTLRIIDTGKLCVSTDKFTSTSSPGAIFVDYDVEFTDKTPF